MQNGFKNYWPSFSHTNHYTSREAVLFIKNLTPDTEYQFLVHATTLCGDSSEVKTTTKTDRDYPIAPDVTAVEYHYETKTAVNVTLWAVKQLNGEISANQVIVSRGPSLFLPNYTNSLYNYITAVQKGFSYYITAELSPIEVNHTRMITIGDGSVFKDKYVNVPLEKGYQYFVYQRAVDYNTEGILNGKEALVAYIRVSGVKHTGYPNGSATISNVSTSCKSRNADEHL